VVTIEANDDTNGVTSFMLTSFVVEESQTGQQPAQTNPFLFQTIYVHLLTVELEIRRNRGLFGRITVLYEVEASGSSGTDIQ